MSRLLLTTVSWLLALLHCAAQDARLFNQVVASTGNVAVQQGFIYAYTVGEVVIFTGSFDNFILTQGFHQPEQTRIVSVEQPQLADWDIEVFPNPVSDRLTIRFSPEKGVALRVSVTDLAGKIILSDQLLTDPAGSMLNCSAWQPGVYFVRMQDPQSRASATARVVRF
ncbi:MAG: T9SS type A sorting domain-containing protein [Thermoanaerobaculia bacterium]|nr:T9SS type A sorting domain-containing protein [Thermoanaerobaculia bacterium]